jgi:predicted alpha/beta superfamily hydrolase
LDGILKYTQFKHYPGFVGEGLLPRDVWVWTPPQYHQQLTTHFPVIYMQDGQNLFFAEKSYTHVTWGVVETITKLSNWGFIQPAIVVGIDNTQNRMGDYLPVKPFQTPKGKAYLAKLKGEAPEVFNRFPYVSDNYLRLTVDVIKPKIDRDFRTLSNPEKTFVMGSSMGALISLYALVEYPDVFGGAGCLSTSWPIVTPFIFPYLNQYLPNAGTHKLYFDKGSQGLDAQYAPFQAKVDDIMAEKGYIKGEDWVTRFFPGADHNEQAWRKRLHIVLRFLLGNT